MSSKNQLQNLPRPTTPPKSQKQSHPVELQIVAGSATDAKAIGQSLQSIAGCFTPAELARVATKLQDPANQKLIKTFL